MVSVPTSHLVIFIASIAVAAGVAGAFTAESSRMSATIEDVGIDVSSEVHTDIEIISDPGAGMYDPVDDEITVLVQNLGETTLPHDVDQVDVFLDGDYQTAANLSLTVQGASSWASDEVLQIDIAAPDLSDGDHRLKVVVDGDEDVIVFNKVAGCNAVTRTVLVFQDASTDDLAFVDRSGTVTDLGVPTGGDQLRAIGPAADFDCDGLLEAPYVVGGSTGANENWQAVRLTDENGETQTLETWPGNSGEINDGYLSRLGVGDLDGDGVPEVVFPDPADSEIMHRVEVGENPSQIGSGFDAKGVGGLGDFNGDGDLDLVYISAQSGNEIQFLENRVESGTGTNAENGDNIGSPNDFDGDGVARVPIQHDDLLNQIVLVDFNGNTQTLNLETTDAVGSLATFDWDGDGTEDVVWVDDADSDRLYFTELDGTTTRLTDDDGDPIEATQMGVA